MASRCRPCRSRRSRGLSGLSRLGTLHLAGTSLVNSTGLSLVTQLTSLQVSDTPSFVDFTGLAGLTALGELTVSNLPGLTSLGALSSVTGLQTLSLTGVPSLASLTPLASAVPTKSITLDGTGLTDLHGLESVTTLSDGLVIQNNAALTTLAGAGALTNAGSSLGIRNNPRLDDLHGLASLTSAVDVDVEQNAHLSTCEVDWLLTQLGQVGSGASWVNGGDRNCQAGGVEPPLPAGGVWFRHYDVPSEQLADVVLLSDGGSYLLSGQTSQAVDGGGGTVALPRSGDTFSYLLWLHADGTFDSLHFVDGEAWVPPRTAVGTGDDIYFMIGVPKRPFAFQPASVPGSAAPGITFAKLDRTGQLQSAVDVTANIAPWTVDGTNQISTSQPVVASDGVIVVSSLLSGGVAFKFAR